MPTVVTKSLGATTRPTRLLYVEPEMQEIDAGAKTGLEASGLDPAFMADFLSACLSHERCGVHLYRSVAGRTGLDEFRSQYEEFLGETEQHVALLESLITDIGGNPMYVSPSARATELAGVGLVESTWILEGSVDIAAAELSMLEAVMLAEAKDEANWRLLGLLTQMMSAGDVQDALIDLTSRVLTEEEEHLGWAREARSRMLIALATGADPGPASDEDEPIVTGAGQGGGA